MGGACRRQWWSRLLILVSVFQLRHSVPSWSISAFMEGRQAKRGEKREEREERKERNYWKMIDRP